MDYYIYYDLYNERILPIEYDGNTVFEIQIGVPSIMKMMLILH